MKFCKMLAALISSLYDTEKDGVMGGKKWRDTTYGMVVFSVGYFESGEALRNAAISNYGVLPLPMFDEDQSFYKINTVPHVSMLAVCSTLSDDRIPMVTVASELLSAESYETVIPAYYSKVIHGIYSKEEKDAQMYDLVLNSITVDFASCYFRFRGELASYTGIIKSGAMSFNYPLATVVDSKKDAWELEFDLLMEEFANLGK